MLPEILTGSYKKYKGDTSIFLTWLAEASKACGFKTNSNKQDALPISPNIPKEPKLKGRARKLARDAAPKEPQSKPTTPEQQFPKTRYTVTIDEIERQVKVVASTNKKKIQMPLHVRRILERAVNVRERCAKWFKETGVENGYSNEGHAHFINVLRTALDQLAFAKISPRSRKDSTQSLSQDSVDTGGATKVEESLANPFSSLKVEDVDEEYSLVEPQVNLANSAKKPVNDDIMTLKSTTDLITVTLMTNAAIDLVQRAEDQLCRDFRKAITLDHSYSDIALILFYRESVQQGIDPDAYLSSTKSLEVTEFDSFLYLPTARSLIKFSQLKQALNRCAWPPPVMSMRFSYIARPELLKSPEMQKYEEEDKIMSQLLLNLSSTDHLKKRLGNNIEAIPRAFTCTLDDEFSNSVRPLWTLGRIRVHNVFAARIMLDIHDTLCTTVAAPYKEMQDMGDRVQSIFQFHVNASNILDVGGGVRWLAKDNDLLMSIHSSLETRIKRPLILVSKEVALKENSDGLNGGNGLMEIEDLPPVWQERIQVELRKNGLEEEPTEEHKQNAKNLNIQPIKPHEDMSFALSHNPIYCGTVYLHFMVQTEEAGVALANHHLTYFSTCHLYNAMSQQNMIDFEWPELERIVELHVGALFAGEIPTTPQTMSSRLALRIGAYQYSGRSLRSFDEKKLWRISSSCLSTILRQYSERKESIERSLYLLEELMQNDTVKYHQKGIGSITKQKKTTPRNLTPLHFLRQLEDYLPKALPDIAIDYINLTRTCNQLIMKLRAELQRKINKTYPIVQTPGDSNDHGHTVMASAILRENEDVAKLHGMRKTKEPFAGGPQLMIAAKVFKDFWRKTSKAK